MGCVYRLKNSPYYWIKYVGADGRPQYESSRSTEHAVAKDMLREREGTHDDRATGQRLVILIECKHWVAGGKVTLRFAQKLLDVVARDKATAGVLLASNGFGPRLLEQKAVWEQKRVFLRKGDDLFNWLTVWERQYGEVLVRPVDPRAILLGDTAAGPR